jgi:hypothetical protein
LLRARAFLRRRELDRDLADESHSIWK